MHHVARASQVLHKSFISPNYGCRYIHRCDKNARPFFSNRKMKKSLERFWAKDLFIYFFFKWISSSEFTSQKRLWSGLKVEISIVIWYQPTTATILTIILQFYLNRIFGTAISTDLPSSTFLFNPLCFFSLLLSLLSMYASVFFSLTFVVSLCFYLFSLWLLLSLYAYVF
jgi:hypothetical protein